MTVKIQSVIQNKMKYKDVIMYISSINVSTSHSNFIQAFEFMFYNNFASKCIPYAAHYKLATLKPIHFVILNRSFKVKRFNRLVLPFQHCSAFELLKMSTDGSTNGVSLVKGFLFA